MWPRERSPWRGSFVESQALSLRRMGVEIDVLSIAGYISRVEYARAALRVARLNRGCTYDIVHAHYGHSGVVARAQLGARLVISYCGNDLLAPGPRRERIEAAVFRQLARLADATITKSAEMELCLPRALRQRNSVIPNGVDLERFRPVPRADARQRLGWDPDERTLLFVGDPEIETKNFPIAAAVHRRVHAEIPTAKLRVADRVPHDLIPLWLSAADVLVFPSRSEGSPNAVKEAMAAELPIVSSPVGDVPALLGTVPGCFVCPPEPEPMAEAVLSALEVGRTPQARAAITPLALDAVARRVLEVYRRVL
jgi:glycosyltransferase involved in cell wall biosynthesis